MRRTVFAAVAAVLVCGKIAAAADPVCGDVNSSGAITTSDALAVLKKSVGQQVALQCAAPGLLVQTGEAACYDDTGASMDCAGSGQDGELRRGLVPNFTDKGDGTMVDNKTGLVWEQLDDDNQVGADGIHDWNNTYTWTEAQAKIAVLNKIKFAGFTDWRLPNVKELYSLVDLSRTLPAVIASFDNTCEPDCTTATCSCTQSYLYWSSSSYELDPSYAWGVDFVDGPTVGHEKTDSDYVRAVRGGA